MKQVYELGQEEQSTLFMTLLAAYNVLLFRYTAQEDIVVGTPVAGRPHADLEETVGVFINILPLRNYPLKHLTFREFLRKVKERVLGAYEHADYSFHRLVENLELERDLSRHPLFDTMLNLQNFSISEEEIPGLLFRRFEWNYPNAKYDLNWDLAELEDGSLMGGVEYSTDLFQERTIERMIGHFLHVLEQVTTDPDRRLDMIELTTKQEKEEILNRFNDTSTPYPDCHLLHQLFEEQVEKTPKLPAVIFENRRLTYEELNEQANRLAHTLRDQGVRRGDLVGLLLDRSPEMIVGILGVLKSGGAYVPIDPGYPGERKRYMLEDSGVQHLVVNREDDVPTGYDGVWLSLPAESGSVPKTNPVWVNDPDDLAYVIYTSGSTGKPKGVMVDHRSVCNLYLMADTYGIREGTRVLQLASYSFDASVGDIFHTLLSGATLYLSTREQLSSGREFVDWLRSNRIETIPFIPPSVLKTLPLEDLPDLHTISPSGESLPLDLIGTWGRERTFINAYGPTETVVDATVHICEPQMDKSIIGKPIPNKKVYVVNENGQLQPVGVPGELWIGGIGVARGYLNRPELTRERFVTAPFAPGERLYRSGDLVRWLPDGSLEYKGRMDDQVKIRGHRIELGEIEARLLQHPAVREAVVVSRQDDEGMAYLAAYFTSDSQWTSEELRVFLARELPEYMLPSRFMELMDLPLNPNGKVDKHALPEPPVPETGTANYIPPRNEMEQLLADIWQDILRIEKVGIRDNFFELGGDSIKAIQIAARLHEQQLRFEMKDLFRHPTIAELAPLTRRLEVKREQGPMEGEVPLTPIQHWFFEQPLEAPHHYNQSMMLYRAEGWDSVPGRGGL